MSARGGPAGADYTGADLIDSGDSSSMTPHAAAHKWQRVLRALLDGPRTTRQLERAPVYDHCGHSTAAELRGRGVEIITDMVEIVGYAGLPARVARYSLTDAGRERAIQLLGEVPHGSQS